MRISHKALRARNAVLIANNRSWSAVISAALSDLLCSGIPLVSLTSAIVSMPPKLLMRRATLIARHSRVRSSVKVACRSFRPVAALRLDEAITPDMVAMLRPQVDARSIVQPQAARVASLLSVFSSSRSDINTTIWRSSTKVCTASNLFFGITKALLQAQFVIKLGPKKPGQAQPIAARFWPSLQAGASTTVTRGRPDNSHG